MFFLKIKELLNNAHILKGELLCFSILSFSVTVYVFPGMYKILKVKKQTLISPTENPAPEMPRQ